MIYSGRKTDGTAAGAGVFNGDVGEVNGRSIRGEETLTVLYDDQPSGMYRFHPAGSSWSLPIAMTVHKSQGSEYRAVILTAWGGSPYLLTRSVLYTAITRAKELLIVVGREETVMAMTANAQKNKRYSGLKLRLQGRAE